MTMVEIRFDGRRRRNIGRQTAVSQQLEMQVFLSANERAFVFVTESC